MSPNIAEVLRVLRLHDCPDRFLVDALLLKSRCRGAGRLS